jgi:hypothetical protein
MRHTAVTVPAFSVEFLGAHHNILNRLFVTAEAVLLYDFLGVFSGADDLWGFPEREHIGIVHARAAFFIVVRKDRVMRQVTFTARSRGLVTAVEPVLVDRIHHMAGGTGFGFAAEHRGRIGGISKSAKRDYSSQDGDDQWYFCHALTFLYWDDKKSC